MESSVSTVPALGGRTALSAALVERAEFERVGGDLAAARCAVTSAIPLDPTPAARYVYAELLAASDEPESAIQQLELAWELSRRLQSPSWRAHCCHALAELHRQGGRRDLADRYRQWAIRAELDAGGDVSAAVWLRDRVADALAVDACDDAATLVETMSRLVPRDSQSQTQVQSCRGVLAVRQGRWSQGLRCFVQAFHLCRAVSDYRGCAEAVLRVGHILQTRGEWRRATSCFAQATRMLQRLGANEAARRADRSQYECDRIQAVLTGNPERN